MIKFGSLLLFLAAAFACATAHPGKGDYDRLKKKITNLHQSALFTASSPFLFSQENVDSSMSELIKESCPKEDPERRKISEACGRKVEERLIAILSDKYYAANQETVSRRCSAEPLTCEDPIAFEVLFRKIHNNNIKTSLASKLEYLDEWRSGRLTNDQLMEKLRFHFVFSDEVR